MGNRYRWDGVLFCGNRYRWDVEGTIPRAVLLRGTAFYSIILTKNRKFFNFWRMRPTTRGQLLCIARGHSSGAGANCSLQLTANSGHWPRNWPLQLQLAPASPGGQVCYFSKLLAASCGRKLQNCLHRTKADLSVSLSQKSLGRVCRTFAEELQNVLA